VAISRKTRFSH